jgi:cobalamin synthase
MGEDTAKNQTPFPGWQSFVQALRERTLMGGDDPERRVDTGAVYYPLIGLAFGAAALLVDEALRPLGSAAASAAIIATWAVLSRGRSLLALARTLAAAVQPNRQHTFTVLEARPGPLVWLLAAAIAAGETRVLAALDHYRAIALLFAPMLGHCAMVVTATGSRQARADDRALKFSPTLTFREFGIASTATFAAVFLTTDFLGLLMVLVTGLLTIGLRLLLHYRFGGVTIASLAALGEIVQWTLIVLLTRL